MTLQVVTFCIQGLAAVMLLLAVPAMVASRHYMRAAHLYLTGSREAAEAENERSDRWNRFAIFRHRD